MKAMLVSLSFIFEKSVKSMCSAEDLEKEMLQIGFSDEHCKQLIEVYTAEKVALTKLLANDFLRAPSFSVVSQSEEQDGSVNLRIRTSDSRLLTLSASEQKLNALRIGLSEALKSLEPYMK